MVRPEEDNGVLVQSRLFQLIDQIAGPGVHRRDQLVVAFPVFASDRCVGVVRRQRRQRGGVLTLIGTQIFGHRLVLAVTGDAAFMTTGKVKNCKEGLVLGGAVFPVSFSARLVPDFIGRWIFELVVGLAVVGAVVTGFAKRHRERLEPLRERGIAAHVVRSDAVLIHPRDDRRSAGSTDARGCERVRVTNTFFGQLVQVRSDCVRVTITTQVCADVLARNPNHIRLLFGC